MLKSMLQDATTNPSLILAAANKPGYAHLIDAAVKYGKQKGGDLDAQANAALDRLVRYSTQFSCFVTQTTINFAARRVWKSNLGHHSWPRLH